MIIHQEDWLMRQIEEMLEAVISLLLRETPRRESAPQELKLSDTVDPDKREQIDAFLRSGRICEAEDWLFDNLTPADPSWLPAAVYLYDRLNALPDETLNERNFSRPEIASGLAEVCEVYGYAGIL